MTATPGLLSFQEAINNKPVLDWTNFTPFPAHFLGVSPFDVSDQDTVRTYLDWNGFFQKWELPLPFPDLLDDPDWGESTRRLFGEANIFLEELLAEQNAGAAPARRQPGRF